MWLDKLLKDYVVGTLKKTNKTKKNPTESGGGALFPGCVLMVSWGNLSVPWPGGKYSTRSETQIGERQMNIWMNGSE